MQLNKQLLKIAKLANERCFAAPSLKRHEELKKALIAIGLGPDVN
jgi:hypothetical protein